MQGGLDSLDWGNDTGEDYVPADEEVIDIGNPQDDVGLRSVNTENDGATEDADGRTEFNTAISGSSEEPDDEENDPTDSDGDEITLDNSTLDELMRMTEPPRPPSFYCIIGPFDPTYYTEEQIWILFYCPPPLTYNPDLHAPHYPIPASNHNPPDLMPGPDRRPCRHWTTGHCRNGSMCDCWHDPHHLPQAVCRTFLRGQTCRDDCHHIHGTSTSDEPGRTWFQHPDEHAYPHLIPGAITRNAHTEPPCNPREWWLRLNPATNRAIYLPNMVPTVWPQRQALLNSRFYKWVQANKDVPTRQVDLHGLNILAFDQINTENQHANEVRLYRETIRAWKRLHDVPDPPANVSNEPSPTHPFRLSRRYRPTEPTPGPGPGLPGSSTDRPPTVPQPAKAPPPKDLNAAPNAPTAKPQVPNMEPSMSNALAIAKPTKAPPPDCLSAPTQGKLTVTVNLPTPELRPNIQFLGNPPSNSATPHALAKQPMLAPNPTSSSSQHLPPLAGELALHLNQLSTPIDPFWGDSLNLMDSVMDHLYHWFDHVRSAPTPIEYIREATYIVGPAYLSNLGATPLDLHTNLLRDIRYALHTILTHLANGQPYIVAANTGPRQAITTRSPPTYLVDPTLLLQLAHESLRHHTHAEYYRLPDTITLRRLQQYFNLREPSVPNVPAIKAPPTKAIKAPPQVAPTPLEPASP